VLYNPLSIERAVERICRREEVHEEELCQRGDVWFSYHTHGDFDGLCPQGVCQRINGALKGADHWLQQAEVVILTLGTAWVYEREGEVVANCHKMPAEEFRRGFTACLEQGDTVIYVGCALPLSGSVNTATVVAKELLADRPDGKIFCIDAKNCCNGEGMLAILAATLRNDGKSAEEIVAAVEERRDHVNQYVTVGSLDMLKKSGRVKGAAAFFGNLLGVKPIIISDANGQNVPIVKVKGRNASLDKLVELVKESVVDAAAQTVYIQHADCPEAADYLKEKLMSLGFADACIGTIGPVVGACIGPDAVGVWCFGKKIEMAV
jgi:DegV family protein with EDD domain